jgi:polysaccharide biosynthesis/export protein
MITFSGDRSALRETDRTARQNRPAHFHLSGCRPALVAFLLAALAALSAVQAQERRSTQQQYKPPPQGGGELAPPPNAVIAPEEEYRIGPGDVIEVYVEDAPELSKSGRVSPRGTFLMNYLQHIPVQGKTSEELSALIADKLRDRYLKNPQVTVNVKQINSHSFFIQGAVRRPGMYQIEGKPSLMKLITVAGGLQDSHASTAFIIRELKAREKAGESAAPAASAGGGQSPGATASGAAPDQPSGQAEELDEDVKYELLKTNVNYLFKGRFDQNVLLEPGDIVNIPPADVFFVAGEVREPGSYTLKEGTTLRQAISLAQGTTVRASAKRGIIYREGSDGRREEVKVDIAAVMDGKKDDVPISPNDIIIVPNSSFKSTALPILGALSGGASTAVGTRIILR